MREQEPKAIQPLRKSHDYLYEYRGLWQDGATVRIRIYSGPLIRPVVITTEPPDNPGSSVTNMVEYLAAEIIEQHFSDTADEHGRPVFIEHYPPRQLGNRRGDETFDLVEFPLTQPKPVLVGGRWRTSLGEPSWRRLDKAEVERLIGQAIDLRSPRPG